MCVPLVVVFILASALSLRAQDSASGSPAPSWKGLEFLFGNWMGMAGERDTPLGAGQGGFSFAPELDGRIVVRRNRANYDSGVRHEDLMVIYLESPNERPYAIYFDTEGHVIRYNLTFPSANRVTFESDGTQPGPRYRLS